MPQTKEQIAEIIKALHEIVDNLEGSTVLEIDMWTDFIDVPGTGLYVQKAATGDISISIRAYNPAKDQRCQMFGLDNV